MRPRIWFCLFSNYCFFYVKKGLLSDYSTKKRVKGTGLSADQLAKNDQKLQEKMTRKPDAVDESSQKCGPNFKSTRCGISKAGAKESKSDWKKK